MAVLTIPQMAQLAVDVGIPQGQPLYTCVSIGLAESSGRTDAENVNSDGSKDRGVWQINSVHDQLMPGADRFDPVVNAQLMAQISSKGTNWQPWTTYTSGAYLTHMARVMGELQGQQLNPSDPGVTNGLTLGSGGGAAPVEYKVASSLSGIDKFAALLTDPHGWVRVIKVVLGLQFMAVGVILLLGTSKIGQQAIGAATDVVQGAAKAAATKGKL